MMKISRKALILLFLLVGLTSPGGWASGGVIKRKTQKVGGYYYNALTSAAARYCALYGGDEFDPNAIICGTSYLSLDQSVIQPGVDDYTLLPDLRFADPNSPGYADLTPAGLIADADVNSLTSCSTLGIPQVGTFGGGAGVPDPLTPFVITLLQPANNDANELLDFCGIILDTASLFVNSARTQGVGPGSIKTTIGFNHFVEAIVFEPKPIDLQFGMTGSSRFPGDRGLPVMFARRRCDTTRSDCVTSPGDQTERNRTDDFVTARFVIDNNRRFPDEIRLTLEAERCAINPKLGPVEVLDRFRLVGGGGGITNPILLPVGRTVLSLELRAALARRFVRLFPLDIQFIARIDDPNEDDCYFPGDPDCEFDTERKLLGLRPNAGFYDDGRASGGFFFTQSPVVTGDAFNVRFDAIDLLSTGATSEIRGAQVLGGEFGASGLIGFDAFELRREDTVLEHNPDLSPQGLLRHFSTVGDPGNADGIPTGIPITTVNLDFTNLALDASNPDLAANLFGMVFLNPGDTLTSLTAIGSSDGSSGNVLVGNSSILSGGTLPVVPMLRNDVAIRLDCEGALGSELFDGRRHRPIENPSLRQPGVYKVVDRHGNILH